MSIAVAMHILVSSHSEVAATDSVLDNRTI